jgi:hypothetical protein
MPIKKYSTRGYGYTAKHQSSSVSPAKSIDLDENSPRSTDGEESENESVSSSMKEWLRRDDETENSEPQNADEDADEDAVENSEPENADENSEPEDADENSNADENSEPEDADENSNAVDQNCETENPEEYADGWETIPDYDTKYALIMSLFAKNNNKRVHNWPLEDVVKVAVCYGVMEKMQATTSEKFNSYLRFFVSTCALEMEFGSHHVPAKSKAILEMKHAKSRMKN